MARTADRAGLPPGPPLTPALQTAAWVAAPGPFMRSCARRYGARFTVQLAGEGPCVYLADPADAARALAAPGSLAGAVNRQLAPILGERSILLLDGEEHLEHRRLVLPAFGGSPLEAARRTVREVAEAAVATWPAHGTVALRPRLQELTLTAILRVALGVPEGPRLAVLQRAVARWLSRASSPAALVPAFRRDLGPGSPWRGFLAARGEVHALFEAELRSAVADPRRGERTDVVALLSGARRGDGAPVPLAELRDQLVTLLLAGHETTATALAWALHELTHAAPAVRAGMREEVERGEDGPWTAAVVREALRLHPPIPVVGRRLAESMPLAGGGSLPAGTVAVPCAWLVHRWAEAYPEAERFRPERFGPGATPPPAQAWIPYGGGLRRCLGARFAEVEMRTVLHAVLAARKLSPSGRRPERQRWRAIVLGPARGARVRVAPRAARPAPHRSARASSGGFRAGTG